MIEEYFKQPYPQIIHKWKLIIAISSFISVFMLLFQPFGLSEYQSNSKIFVVIGYGGVTFIILIINLFVITRILKIWFVKWTILKQIFWLSWIIFTIGIGNYFYTSTIFPVFNGINGFFIFQIFTIFVGVFPVVTLTLISQNIKLSNNLKVAGEINDLIFTKRSTAINEKTVVLIADNEKDKLEVEFPSLLYVESVGNYIQVNYLKGDIVTKTLLRSTIKRIESQIAQYPSLVKCHRAFIINIDHVGSVKGNSQGLKIVLKNVNIEIPVSRNHSQRIKKSLC